MPRLALPLLLAALAVASCDRGTAGPSPATTGDAAATTSASPSALAAPPPPSPARPPLPTREGGTIARAPTGDALYVADEDHGVVRRVPLPLAAVASPPADVSSPGIVDVPMPGLPAQVLPLHDRVLVTVRSEGGKPPAKPPEGSKESRIPTSPTGPGLLLILRPDPAAGLVEIARVTLPQDAWGIAVTPDEKTALVSSAWTHQVSAIDLASAKKRWSIDVPREPRAVVVRPDGASAYVTHLVGAAVTRLDDIAGEPKAHAVTLPASLLRAPYGKTLDASLAYAGALSPDGRRFYVARHALGALGEAAWFGAATVDVLLTADDTPLAPRREPGLPRAEAPVAEQMAAMSRESAGSFPRISQAPFAEPRAVVYRKRTQTILVASEGTNQVIELDARAVDPTMLVARRIQIGAGKDRLIPVATSGGAPSGLALSTDESTLWVFCRATDDVVQVSLDEPVVEKALARLHLAGDLLGEPDGEGRRIFYDATDGITSGGVSCAGCHPEGRDDAHVWHEARFQTNHRTGPEATNFLADADEAPLDDTKAVGYARQTPMLAGRVSAPGPYGWHAESPDLVARLIDGFGLHRWGPNDPAYGKGELLGRAQYLVPFLRHGLVPPPRDVHPLTPEEARGKEIFTSEQAKCAKCHVPESEYTDRIAYPLSPALPPATGFAEEKAREFKTPSLFFVGGTPPYFHDGRFSTLESLLELNGDRMGHTSHLSREDKAALAAFLRTL